MMGKATTVWKILPLMSDMFSNRSYVQLKGDIHDGIGWRKERMP